MAKHLPEAQRIRMMLHQRTHQMEMRNQGQMHKE